MKLLIRGIYFAALVSLSPVATGETGFDTRLFAANLESMAKTLEAPLTKKTDSLPVFDVVKDFDANNNGRKTATKQLQQAIDECAKKGPGKVYFPPGAYLTGTLVLKSGVHIELAKGARIIASTAEDSYPEFKPGYNSHTDSHVKKSLFYAENVNGVSMTGKGTIDFQGDSPVYMNSKDNDVRRPHGIRFVSSSNIYVSGLMLTNSAKWMQHYLDCENVMIENLTVFNHANRNNDGIDIDGSRNVYVRNCRIDSDDDGICLKSSGPAPCENVLVENCISASHCNALKLGTESTGGFKNILFRNCRVMQSASGPHHVNGVSSTRTAITLIITDGGHMENVWFDNIQAEGCITPIFVTLGNRGRKHDDSAPEPAIGRIENIKFSNIKASGAGPISSSITGLDASHVIRNVSLENIQVTLTSPGDTKDRETDMEQVLKKVKSGYPSPHKWGRLPSHGLYLRHLDGLQLQNVTFKLECADPREAIIIEDCVNTKDQR